MSFKQSGDSTNVQYRYYEQPADFPVLALLGSRWIRAYGSDTPESHFHNLMEIGYCYDGTGDMVYENKNFPFSPGNFSVIPPNLLHNTIASVGTKSRWEYMLFDADAFLYKHYGQHSQTAQNMINSINSGYLHLRHGEHKETGDLIVAVFNACRANGKYCTEEVNGLLIALLARLSRLTAKGRLPEFAADTRLEPIQASLNFIQKNFEHDISVSDVANASHISEVHCRRLFEKNLKINPLAYINLVRIANACKLMNQSDEQISEIAIKCGFVSLSTFNRNFKDFLGVSPLQWRKGSPQYRSSLDNKRIFLFNGWM